MSAITRAAANEAVDGFRGSVTFASTDRFALDGARLIATSGNDGESGTTYEKELHDFSRIRSLGKIGNGPEKWTVETKAGLTMEYGGTPDSRRVWVSGAETLTWLLSSVRDTVGNEMRFFYQQEDGDSLITKIEYTSNAPAGRTADSTVDFFYDGRPDRLLKYFAGEANVLQTRLVEVIAKNAGKVVRKYNIGYETSPDTGASRLSRIIERAVDPSSGEVTSFEPTEFTWQSNGQPVTFNPPRDTGAKSWGATYIDDQVADFTGDGVSDLLIYNTALTPPQVELTVNGGQGIFGPAIRTGILGFDGRLGDYVRVFLGDFNGDGKMDLVQYYGGVGSASTNTYRLFLATGNGFDGGTDTRIVPINDSTRPPLPGDYNGDGRTDVLLWTTQNGKTGYHRYLSNGTTLVLTNSSPLPSWDNGKVAPQQIVGDYNGDGLTDVLMWYVPFNNGRYNLYLANSSGFDSAVATDIRTWDNPWIPNFAGDFNGDGLTDVAVWHVPFNNNRYNLYLCTGKGFAPAVATTVQGNDQSNVLRQSLNDFNGDGMMDMFVWKSSAGRYGLYPSLSGSFGPEIQTVVPSYTNVKIMNQIGDFNGDGRSDVLVWHYPSPGNSRYNIYASGGIQPDLLSKATNGHGGYARFEYKAMTDSSVYTKGQQAAYPRMNLQASMHVVSSMSVRNGIDDGASVGESRTTYEYKDAQVLLNGRGYQQAKEIKETNEATGISNTTFFGTKIGGQEEPLLSSYPSRSETRLVSSNRLLSESSSNWQLKPRSPTANRRTFHAITSSSTSKTYAPESGTLIKAVTTSGVDYDTNGNLKTSSTTTEDELTGQLFSESTTNTYQDNVSDSLYILGRLKTASVTKSAPGVPSLTRSSAFDYHPTTGLLTLEIKEPNDPKLRTEKSYRHDAFGNIEHSELKAWNGIGQPALNEIRTTTTTYTDDKRFILKTTNGLGHSETTLHEPLYGLVELQEGPNKIQTEVDHDGFGRPKLEKRIDGSETQTWYRRCTPGVDGAPARAVHCAITQSSASAASTIYYDVLDREIRKAVVGFDDRLILVDKEYNARGEVVRVSQPYFAGETPLWTVYTYDAVGRVLTETAPGARVTTTLYDKYTTTVTNPENQTASRRVDARGLMVEATDALGQKLSYQHDAYGNLLEVTDLLTRTVTNTLTYDNAGRKLSLAEPNSGTTTYAYNGFGELILQSTSDKRVTTFTYDRLGRLLTRKEPEGTAKWFYDYYKSEEEGIEAKSVGKLLALSQPGYAEYYRFDSFGRPIETITQIGGTVSKDPLNGRKLPGEKFTTTTAYDHVGRVDTITWPTGFAVRNNYRSSGHLLSVENANNVQLKYWRANTVNARGQVEQETLGNGLVSNRTFVPETGLAATIRTGRNGLNDVQNLSFHFDKIGNLDERRDISRGMTEAFIYDDLNRLTSAATTGVTSDFPSVAVAYDGLGNVRSRTDAGTMEYAELAAGPGRKLLAGPHAVTSLSSRPGAAPDLRYSYDLRGNRIKSERLVGRSWTTDLNLKFNTANLPVEIVSPAVSTSAALPDGRKASSSTFSYAPDRARYRQVQKVSGRTTLDRFYIGRLYELEKRGSVKRHVHYIPAGGGTVAIQQSEEGAGALPERTLYLHKDHLGSIETLTDQNGTFVENFSFDAWGRRRTFSLTGGTFALNYTPADPRPAANVSRGFTGHEMLDAFGLVHMNGRIYDPLVGRFLSADPIVQEMDNLQNLNRYSYVLNNPLSLTDPTGYSFLGKIGKWIGKNWKQIVSIGIGIALAVFLPGSWAILARGFVAGFGGAFSGTLLAGGSIGDALRAGVIGGAWGALSAGVADKVGGVFAAADPSKGIPAGSLAGYSELKPFVHGVTQGGIRSAQGGKFTHGFLAAFSTSSFEGAANYAERQVGSSIAGNAVAAVVGGTAEALGGGKFSNGAVTAAFVDIYNRTLHPKVNTGAYSNEMNLEDVPGGQLDSSIASNYRALLRAANDDLIFLWPNNTYRTSAEQIELRTLHCGPTDFDIYDKDPSLCKPPTARPGTSNHERGGAVDFSGVTSGSREFKWLKKNAPNYGFHNLPSEPWHWSINGK